MEFTRYVFLSIGANLPGNAGHPLHTLKAAVQELGQLSDAPLLVSPCYESDPKDCPPDSPRYCNAVVGLLPGKSLVPVDLLKILQKSEANFGRHRSGLLNEARTLDLDILIFPDVDSNTPELMLPHPRAHERRFVLEPWIALVGEDFLLHKQPLQHWLQICRDAPLARLE